jgi:hypothetical protein
MIVESKRQSAGSSFVFSEAERAKLDKGRGQLGKQAKNRSPLISHGRSARIILLELISPLPAPVLADI